MELDPHPAIACGRTSGEQYSIKGSANDISAAIKPTTYRR